MKKVDDDSDSTRVQNQNIRRLIHSRKIVLNLYYVYCMSQIVHSNFHVNLTQKI